MISMKYLVVECYYLWWLNDALSVHSREQILERFIYFAHDDHRLPERPWLIRKKRGVQSASIIHDAPCQTRYTSDYTSHNYLVIRLQYIYFSFNNWTISLLCCFKSRERKLCLNFTRRELIIIILFIIYLFIISHYNEKRPITES